MFSNKCNIIKVLNLSDFIIDEKVVCNLYNKNSATYITKGKSAKNINKNLNFYVSENDFNKYNTVYNLEIEYEKIGEDSEIESHSENVVFTGNEEAD